MIWIDYQIAQAKQELLEHIPPYLSSLQEIVIDYLKTWLNPEIVVAIASAKAVGAPPENAVRVTSGLIASLISVRVLDDLQDQDRPDALWIKIGPARALNYVLALQTLSHKIFGKSPSGPPLSQKILDEYVESALVTLAGQERDLMGVSKNWDDYWLTIEMKTCYMMSTIASLGALAGTEKEEWIKASRVFGYHWGMAVQILNDLSGVWEAEGKSDLEQGKITLPLLYGMHCEHARLQELSQIVWQNRIAQEAGRIKEILDAIDTKSYLLWAALQQRTKAFEAIQILPDPEGKQALEFYFNALFGDMDEVLAQTAKLEDPDKISILDKALNLSPKSKLQENTSYQSSALDIRHRLRFSQI